MRREILAHMTIAECSELCTPRHRRLTSGDDGVDRFLRPGAFSVLTGKHVPIRKNDL